MFMNMFVCLSTSQTNEHWPLIGRTNEHDLTNTVRLFIGHPVACTRIATTSAEKSSLGQQCQSSV